MRSNNRPVDTDVWFGFSGDGRELRAGAAAEGCPPGPGAQAGTRAQDLPPCQAVADQAGLRLLGVGGSSETGKNSGAARIDIQRFPYKGDSFLLKHVSWDYCMCDTDADRKILCSGSGLRRLILFLVRWLA
jgi:hypothetical protein